MEWIIRPGINTINSENCVGTGRAFVCGTGFTGECDGFVRDCGGTVYKGPFDGCVMVACVEHTCVPIFKSSTGCGDGWTCKFVNCVELIGGCHQTNK